MADREALTRGSASQDARERAGQPCEGARVGGRRDRRRPPAWLRTAWARTGYRPWARLLHRVSLHHTRRIGPLEDGAIVHRCEWCGLSRREGPRR
jgi:hypothetical protein